MSESLDEFFNRTQANRIKDIKECLDPELRETLMSAHAAMLLAEGFCRVATNPQTHKDKGESL